MKAIWKETVIAESDNVRTYDNVPYFPMQSLREEYFKKGSMKSICPCKGETLYYDIEIDGSINQNAAWYFPNPKVHILKDYVGFWRGVAIKD